MGEEFIEACNLFSNPKISLYERKRILQNGKILAYFGIRTTKLPLTKRLR